MAKTQKYRTSKQAYVSPSQLTLAGFEAPFSQQLKTSNRWVVLAHTVPWDFISTWFIKILSPARNFEMKNLLTLSADSNYLYK